MLHITSMLKIKSSLKLKILTLFIQSQFIFDLKIYHDIPLTWISQTLDSVCTSHIRTWLEQPVSACVTETLQLPRNRGGIGFRTFRHLAEKMRLVGRNTLRVSNHDVMREIWRESSTKYVVTDSRLTSSASCGKAVEELNAEVVENAATHLYNLECQGVVAKTLNDCIRRRDIALWSSLTAFLPGPQFIFVRKALVQCLPTASNLVR